MSISTSIGTTISIARTFAIPTGAITSTTAGALPTVTRMWRANTSVAEIVRPRRRARISADARKQDATNCAAWTAASWITVCGTRSVDRPNWEIEVGEAMAGAREAAVLTVAGGGITASPASATAPPRAKPASAGRVRVIFPGGVVVRQVVLGIVEAVVDSVVAGAVGAVVAVAVVADGQRIHL